MGGFFSSEKTKTQRRFDQFKQAIEAGDADAVKKCLTNPKLDPNCEMGDSEDGKNAVMYALSPFRKRKGAQSWEKNRAVAEVLLADGRINLRAINRSKKTLFGLIIGQGKNNGDPTSALLLVQDKNFPFDQLDESENTVLHLFAYAHVPYVDTFKKIADEIVKKVNVNAVDIDGDMPLHVAIKMENAKLVTYLLGVPEQAYNIANNQGDTALHLLARSEGFKREEYEALMTSLIEKSKSSLNVKNKQGQTPLAILNEKIEKIRNDRYSKYGDGYVRNVPSTLLDEERYWTLSKQLILMGTEITIKQAPRDRMLWLDFLNSLEVIRAHLNKDVTDILKNTITTFDGSLPKQSIQKLLKDINVFFDKEPTWQNLFPAVKQYYWQSALVLSAHLGKAPLVSFFIEKGARPDMPLFPFEPNRVPWGFIEQQTLHGQTAITALSDNASLEYHQIVDTLGALLAKDKSVVDSRNHQGQTPLIFAVMGEKVKFVWALLQNHMPDITLQYQGRTVVGILKETINKEKKQRVKVILREDRGTIDYGLASFLRAIGVIGRPSETVEEPVSEKMADAQRLLIILEAFAKKLPTNTILMGSEDKQKAIEIMIKSRGFVEADQTSMCEFFASLAELHNSEPELKMEAPAAGLQPPMIVPPLGIAPPPVAPPQSMSRWTQMPPPALMQVPVSSVPSAPYAPYYAANAAALPPMAPPPYEPGSEPLSPQKEGQVSKAKPSGL